MKKERKQSEQQILLEDFKASWDRFHAPEEYFINWGKDMTWATTLIEMNVPRDVYQERKNNYLRNPKWWQMCRHSFAAFVNNFNQFVPEKKIQRREATEAPLPRILFCGCGARLDSTGLCLTCYPLCASCHQNHAVEVTCKQHAKIASGVERMFSSKAKRKGKAESISGLLGGGTNEA